jgi:hypothetical protein
MEEDLGSEPSAVSVTLNLYLLRSLLSRHSPPEKMMSELLSDSERAKVGEHIPHSSGLY